MKIDKYLKLWNNYWQIFLFTLVVANAILILSLEQLYQHGIIRINYSGYIAVITTLLILLVMTVGYARDIVAIVKQQDKDRNSRD